MIVALGGDGTTLAALRSGAEAGKPVLGVACGSLGALTAVTAADLEEALDRFAAGDWVPRALPALAAESEGAETLTAHNDLVIVRQGGGPGLGRVCASTTSCSSASPATAWWSARRSARPPTRSPPAARCSRPATAGS